jgi:plastocyanin
MSVALLTCLALFGAGWAAASAQDTIASAHPSHVHAGSCADLDPNPAYPLQDVAPVTADGGAGSVETGTTTLDVSLDDLLASPFAINVHESAENVSTYIACGDIAGPVVDGTLLIALGQQNDSGYSGVAVLSAAEAGSGTDVAVYLVQNPAATPEAAASPENAETVAVSIFDFGFDGESVEVPVGTTVTWTNDGQVIHTTTSTDGLWDSKIMNTGDTFSYTFDEPGTFEYLCSLHPSMVGTIVVTGS